MRVSLNWIKNLLGVDDFGCSTTELVDRLTLRLAEIDALESSAPELDEQVVVGRVVSCEQHPDADRLSVTSVDVGADAAIPVVCGAPNVTAGQTVAVALPGARLTLADGKELKIKKGKLRGVASHGMICAADELGLGDDHSGILVLDDGLTIGAPLADQLPGGDQVLVVDNHNINHRPDLWGHLGWAREIAVLCDLPAPAAPELAWQPHGDDWRVTIADDGCRAYHGAVVSGVGNGPSPDWMQERLTAVGLRPLGLLVDVTNYVMLELGEPMHAFDQRCLHGSHIHVRRAAAGEVFQTLDGRDWELTAEDLVIADERGPVALAGIMGGAASGVAEDTSTIVLEAATFAAAGIRHTRLRTGLSTDSANHFEKSLYPELAPAAIDRAIDLLRACHPGLQVTARFAAGEKPAAEQRLLYDPTLVERFVGVSVPADEQWRLLAGLGVERDGDQVRIPWWRRKDLSATIDLVEEVARLHGYEHIAPQVPRLPAAAPQENRLRQSEHRCRRLLSACGWDEIATYGFCSEDWATRLGWPADTTIRLQHPLAADQSVLRASLLPNLTSAAGRNRRFSDRVACYEVGKIYGRDYGSDDEIDERLQVAGCCSSTAATAPFYPARDAALTLLRGLGHDPVLQPGSDAAGLQDGRSASLLIGGQCIGSVGELDQATATIAGVDRAAVFIIELQRLIDELPTPAPLQFREPSRYQAVERDFTFVSPVDLPFGTLAALVRQAGKELVRSVDLAQEIYRGTDIPEGQQAISLRVRLQADDRTLSEKELTKLNKRIIGSIENQSPARLRG